MRRIYGFAGDVERDLAAPLGRAGADRRTDLQRDLDHDLGLLAGLLGDGGDVVLCEAPVSERSVLVAHAARLRVRGVRCAEPICCEVSGAVDLATLPTFEAAVAATGDAYARGVRPWGWSPRWVARLGPLLRARDIDPAPLLAAARVAADKAEVAGLRAVLHSDGGGDARGDGALFEDFAALAAAWARADGAGQAWVVKARYGGSGRDAVRLLPGRAEPTAPQRGWIERTLRAQGAVWVERWWSRRGDLGLLLVPLAGSTADGVDHAAPRFGLLPAHRAHCDARGQFRGVRLQGWDGAHRRTPASPARAALEQIGQAAAARLAGLGFVGPAGVDLIEREGDPTPWPVELNARHTMGHVAHALGRALPLDAGGWLWIAPRGARDEVEALAGAHGEAFALTPPETARRVVAWCIRGDGEVGR